MNDLLTDLLTDLQIIEAKLSALKVMPGESAERIRDALDSARLSLGSAAMWCRFALADEARSTAGSPEHEAE